MKGLRAGGVLRALLVVVAFATGFAQAGPVEIKVMTRNLYVGADLAPVIESILAVPPDPSAVAAEIASTFADVKATQPVDRMARIAGEILSNMPHVVGLQELSLWQTRAPSVITGSPGPLLDTFDFYRDLITALGGAASPYTLVTRLTGAPVAGTGFDPVLMPVPTDITLIDGSGILVRNDVTVLGFDSFAYTNLTVIPGIGLPVVRGISYVDVEIAGHKVRVASTHLDSIDPAKNLAQSQELADFLDTSPYRDQIALGDFNSIAEPVNGFFIPTGSDQNMLVNGFKDTWLEKGGGALGFTWRDDELLDQLTTDFTQRLDYVFRRGGLQTQSVDIIGEDLLCPPGPATGPCWGSDHAGVLATLAFAPEPGSLALFGLALGLVVWRRRAVS